jgi:hypothetical protein
MFFANGRDPVETHFLIPGVGIKVSSSKFKYIQQARTNGPRVDISDVSYPIAGDNLVVVSFKDIMKNVSEKFRLLPDRVYPFCIYT